MKRIACILLLLTAIATFANAQFQQMTSAEILQGLEKLNTVGSVLYVAAHPDDENTRLLTYLSKEKKMRTGYLSLTRGDGGQNLIGKEQGELLGVIRTQELLAARKIDGAEQFFTRANDFGFSKNPEETFNIWNKDSVLADVVWVIRNFKPDVIICRFPTTGQGGHGHHTASAILALEAFEAAADPKRFPHQLKYTEPWQAKRILWNTFNFGGNNTTSPDQLQVDVGGFNPLLGKSYGEIAAESRSMHKSQGFGSARTRGLQIEYFKHLKGDSAGKDLLEGIDLTWKRITGGEKLQKQIDAIIKKFDAQAPGKILPDLASVYKQIQQLPEKDAHTKYWKQQKLKEAESLMVNAAGLFAEAYAADHIGIPGEQMNITAQVVSRNNSAVKLTGISWSSSDTSMALLLKPNELHTFRHTASIPASVPFSNPYWLREEHDAGLYTVKNQLLIGKPENPPSINIVFHFDISGVSLTVERGLVYKYTDPVKGEVYRPFEILPPATVNISENVFVFSGASPKKVQFIIKANTDSVSGTLNVKMPAGWLVWLNSSTTEFMLKNKGDEQIIEGTLTPGTGSVDGKLTASLHIGKKTYSKSIRRIEYDHIPFQLILRDSEARLVNIDLKKDGNKVGYIPGAGDDVPAALKQVGYDVTILTDELLTNEDLSKYDAIVTGIRAYNTNERLQVHYGRLMEYVRNGGNFIVQYNTNNRIGPLIAKMAPYPFTITRNRVTDENAEVRFTNPQHPALTYPNKITENDFKGWVQERGIYFADELDKNYETVISMNDPNEKPKEGSLIIAKYGKGNFVYTGIAFFRELPAGVPGAYRLFANLLSLPENK